MKPIFIISIPHLPDTKLDFSEIVTKEIQDDYHVIINVDPEIRSCKYQMFSDHEIEPIQIEKLKEMLIK